MKVFQTLERQTQINFLFLFGAGLLFWLSITSLLPVLPSYIQSISPGQQSWQWGGRGVVLSVQSQVGLVMGCFAIGLLLSRTRLGRLSDRRGRKIVILIGTVVATIAPFGYLFMPSIPLLMLWRVFHGLSISAFTTGYSALAIDLSPVDKRGEIIGYMSLVVPIGMSLGPLCGGYLDEAMGNSPVFILSGISGGLALLLASRVKETRRSEKAIFSKLASERVQPREEGFWQVLLRPALRVPTFVMVGVGMVFGTLVTFLPLFLGESGIDLNVGLFYTTAALASFIGRAVTGRASDRYGRGLFISLSLLSYALSMGLLARAVSPSAFLLAAIFEGLGGGVLIPMAIALMSDRSSLNERGLVYAVCLGGFDFGTALAGPILGFAIAPLGYRGLYGISAAIALLALLLFITSSGKSLSHSFRFATGRAIDVYALKEPPLSEGV
ncbi:MFS transporter [Oscillatoria sp. FACHB-1406]|uniref:MFS transporter n=1 Tax=Oscillatoria sp. FACHB-1406 TaxID=2692846 RepID=UPI0016835A5C|nr:MFS transporter [Oscillatoria sp. FACHB-1406]